MGFLFDFIADILFEILLWQDPKRRWVSLLSWAVLGSLIAIAIYNYF